MQSLLPFCIQILIFHVFIESNKSNKINKASRTFFNKPVVKVKRLTFKNLKLSPKNDKKETRDLANEENTYDGIKQKVRFYKHLDMKFNKNKTCKSFCHIVLCKAYLIFSKIN